MNIALINLSGNVGKSTLAVHLFAAMRPGAKIISVESVNSSDADTIQGIEVEEIEASSFREIFRELMMAEGDVILDVGASNVTRFMAEMKKQSAVHDRFDRRRCPREQQRDTISTLEWLAERGLTAHSNLQPVRHDGVSLVDACQIYGYPNPPATGPPTSLRPWSSATSCTTA
jgi:hypothetical protein